MELNKSLELKILQRIERALSEAISKEEEALNKYVDNYREDKYLPERLEDIEEERLKSITLQDCLEYIKQLRESKN